MSHDAVNIAPSLDGVAGQSAAGASPAPAAPLGPAVVSGTFWNIATALIGKVAALGAQVALAWLLLPEEVGLAALTFAIASVAAIFTCGGLLNVLVQAGDRLEEQAPQVMWFALAASTIAAGLAIASAPLGAAIMHQRQVVMLVVAQALTWPLGSLAIIYAARLARDLRFRTISWIQLITSLVHNGGSVVLAALGAGAYALILPIYLSYLWFLGSNRKAAGRIRLQPPRPREWITLLGPASWLALQALFQAIQAYGTSFVAGLMCGTAVTGIFFWGMNLSSQTVYLLAGNLRSVLFPALSRLNNDVPRQTTAFLTLCRCMSLIVAPLCLLQAFTAGPIVRLFLSPRWHPAGIVIFWLSLGVLLYPLATAASSLLLAHARYRALAICTALQGVITTAATVVGTVLGDYPAIAIATAVGTLASSLLMPWLAFRSLGHPWKLFGHCMGRVPWVMLVSAACGAGAWLLTRSSGDWIALAAIGLSMVVGTLAATWLLAPSEAAELLCRVGLERWAVRLRLRSADAPEPVSCAPTD